MDTASTMSFTTVKKILLIFFCLALVFLGFQLLRYHYELITFPYLVDSFESAMLLTTDLMLKGENPYALENMPLAINVYGINYHLAVYPFARFWGGTLLVHRAVAAFFILLSCGLFYVILRRHQIDRVYSLSGVLILYASLLYRYTSVAKPDGLGFFLFLLSVFIMYLLRYSNWSLVLSVLCGVAAFYTKPYFVLSIPYLILYLFLFVSKKKAILYASLAMSLLMGSALIINRIFETYFVNTFFNHVNVATNDWGRLKVQLELFSIFNSGVILLLIVYSLLIVLDRVRGGVLSGWKPGPIRRDLIQRIRWRLDEPFLGIAFPFSLYCFLLSFAIFYFKLGRHVGNMMTYAYHLITPFFVIYVYSLFNVPLQDAGLSKRRDGYNYVLRIPCILISLYLLYASASYLKASPEWNDIEDWRRVERVTLSYKNIMNSQVLVPFLMQQNKPIYDTGQTEFFQYSHYPEWLTGFFPSNAEISKQWNAYENSIREGVREQKFDAIIVTPHEYRPYLEDIEDYYSLVNSIDVCMYHSAKCELLEIWEPRAIGPE